DVSSQQEQVGHQKVYFEALQRLEKKRYSLSFRVLLFLLSIFVVCAALAMVIATLFSGALTVLTFMRNSEILASFKKSWRSCKKLFAVATGLLIGVFSPPLGFGMVIMYLLFHGESIEQGYVGRIFQEKLFR